VSKSLCCSIVVTAASVGFFMGPIPSALAAPDATIEAPDVIDMVLGKAIDELLEETNEPDLKIDTVDYVGGQDQINMTNWVVCAQYPKAGEPISPTTKSISLYVRRPTQESCWTAS